MSLGTILLIILILLLVGALPTWPYSGAWGYYPSGGLGLCLGDCAHSSSPWENLTRKQRRSSVIKTNSARALHQSTSSPKPLCLGN